MALPCFLFYSDFVATKSLVSRRSADVVKGVSIAAGGVRPAEPKGGTGLSIKVKRVDPAVLRAIQEDSGQGPVTVMLKLNSKTSVYSRHPVSNAPGNARERAFNDEVNGIVRSVTSGKSVGAKSRVVQSAANLGVATLQAPISVVKDLLGVEQIDGMKLKV